MAQIVRAREKKQTETPLKIELEREKSDEHQRD
jgi:hypothetical protein